jgi:hypothetical protein
MLDVASQDANKLLAPDDQQLIVGRSRLHWVLRVHVQHYDRHRPHRALGLEPPDSPADLSEGVRDALVMWESGAASAPDI